MRWQWTLIYGLSLLPVGAASLAADAPATLPAAPSTRPATQPTALNDDEQMPVIDAKSIQSVVKLSMENKVLRMQTDLPELTEQTRVRIADFPGKTVAIIGNTREKDNDSQLMINIRHEIAPLPSMIMIYSLFATPTDVRLSVDSEDSSMTRSVQYIQRQLPADNPDPTEKAITLYIEVNDKVTNNKTVYMRLTADNVVDLRRKYPRETAEYFQPMLAAMGQESVPFAVDHRTAWQVLAKYWPLDPKVDQQVQALVKQLDADEYAAREAASEQLEKLGEGAALSIFRMQRDKLSSEQNSRLDAFSAQYRPLPDDEAKRLATDVPFLLDCLYSDPQIRDTAIKQLRDVTGKPVEVNVNASPTAWLATVRTLRKDLLPPPTTKPAAPKPIENDPVQ